MIDVSLGRALASGAHPRRIKIFKSVDPDFFKTKKDIRLDVLFVLEVPARFELANNGFADRGLTTWLRYHFIKTGTHSVPILFDWSG